jgi:hypothetical protein
MDNRILNLTQHIASLEQVAADVWNLQDEDRKALLRNLTFEYLPSSRELDEAVAEIVSLAVKHGANFVMIGGAPFLMPRLDAGLRKAGITPLYAFSHRVSSEVTMDDGTVQKVVSFRHCGFVGWEDPA